MKRKFTAADATRAANALGVRFTKFTAAEMARGMNVELEHRDVTHGALIPTAKIALAHLLERPDYYKLLAKYVERNPSHREIWYHGGPKLTYIDAIKWDRERNVRNQNAAGPGLYWTLDPREAAGYGEHLYLATTKRGFRFMPAGRPSMRFVQKLFELAPRHRQEQFLDNWPDYSLASALANYAQEETALDAAVVLYHDLFQYNADEYVAAMRKIYDGARVIGSGGEHGRAGASGQHLVAWAPDKMIIDEA